MSKRKTTEQFIKEAKEVHGDIYGYSNVVYVNAITNVIIECMYHGDFLQKPYIHWDGHGCLVCSRTTFGKSKKQDDLYVFIFNNYFGEIIKGFRLYDNESDKRFYKELDIYLPDLKLAFEFNGLYWHSEKYVNIDYHKNKTELCENKNVQLIHIYEDDWNYKQEIVKSRILNLLGKSKVIYARKCDIKEVTPKESRIFFTENHIQGYCNSNIRLGLFYNDDLVSLMTFGNSRFEKNKTELLRFCNKLNTTVVGGASKLFNYFLNNNKINSIISYADRSWSNGSLYRQLGFKQIDEIQPNYSYIVDGKRENRFKYRKSVLVEQGEDKNKTEHEIMLEREIYRIYDSGSLKFEY